MRVQVRRKGPGEMAKAFQSLSGNTLIAPVVEENHSQMNSFAHLLAFFADQTLVHEQMAFLLELGNSIKKHLLQDKKDLWLETEGAAAFDCVSIKMNI